VPLFLYLFLVAEQPVASFLVITVGGITDYLDGKIERPNTKPIAEKLYWKNQLKNWKID
jgi:hypothetical protein